MRRWTERSRRSAIAATAAAVLLAACAAPAPPAAEPAAPPDYQSESLDGLAAGGPSLAAPEGAPASWWVAFGSPDLDATIREALAANRDVSAAAATMRQAKFATDAAAGALQPWVDGEAAAGKRAYGHEFMGPMQLPPFSYFALGASAGYDFDLAGGRSLAVEQSRAFADRRRFEWQAARLGLSALVVEQALDLASAQAQALAVEDLVADDHATIDLVQQALAAGSGTRLDLLNARSQLASDQTLLAPLAQRSNAAAHALAVLCGHAPSEWSAPRFSLDSFSLPATIPLQVPSALLRRRPDLQAAESDLRAASAAAGVARARLYPQVVLTAAAGPQAASLRHLFDPFSAAWDFGGQLTAPLFDGGRLRAERQAALQALQATQERYRQAVLVAFGQVADSLTALDADARQVEARRQALDAATASSDLTRQGQREGAVGMLLVLDAHRQFLRARLEYIQATAQRYRDSARLLTLMGCDAGCELGVAPEAEPAPVSKSANDKAP
jgi:NodT family efflux transporter outer membrane factor (OMF) lipoprotein